MSSSGQPELAALADLEEVIRHVSEELASWRRRALKAEGAGVEPDALALRERVLSLETANGELERRLQAARGRVQDLLKRLRFLEEQVAVQGPSR